MNNKLLDKYIIETSYGNKESFYKLYIETKTAVYAYILSILKNGYDAEDVLQEVYINVYNNAGSYKAKNKGLSWIITIAKNCCLMKIRSEKKNSVEFNEELLNIKYNKLITHKQIDDKIFINAIFKEISEEERNILILHVVSGLKFREIADVLNLSLPTVLSKYNRVIKKIKIKLGGNDYK